jgi:hypothetical protein
MSRGKRATNPFSFIVEGQPIDWNRLAANVYIVAKSLTPADVDGVLRAERAELRKQGVYAVLTVWVGRNYPAEFGIQISSMSRNIAKVCAMLDDRPPVSRHEADILAQIAELTGPYLDNCFADAEARRARFRAALHARSGA